MGFEKIKNDEGFPSVVARRSISRFSKGIRDFGLQIKWHTPLDYSGHSVLKFDGQSFT